MLLLICHALLFDGYVSGQATCSSPTLVSGFGVDGDVHANTPLGVGGDSWFYSNVFPGPGIGVIGTTAATATPAISASQFRTLVQTASTSQGRNRTYLQRMNYSALSVVNGYSLIDAFAARDNISPDTTAFAGSNKNGDNPSLWSIATSSVPNKNDIIDVSGHLRREATSARMTSAGKLWMFASVSKLGTGGDSYTDIEIYRTVPVMNLTTGKLTNTGPAATGGHTTFSFNNDGSINDPGDIIICLNYGTGGGVASVKIWCNINNLDGAGNGTTWFNSRPNRPFNFTGDFMIGSGTNGYGYAEITSLSGAACLVYGVLNTTPSTAGAWGNLSSSSATFDNNIQAEQLVNVAFNFTDIGLDFTTLAGPCENVFGALFFKTRSSSSYSAELKDCSGPYTFANFSEIQANAGPDFTLNCTVSQIALNGSSATPGAIINWTTPNGNIVSGASTATPVVDQPGMYIMTAQNPGLSSCIATDTVIVTRNNSLPNVNAGTDLVLTCGQTSATLNGTSSSSGIVFSWNAINGGNIVSGASTATPLVNAAGCYVLTITSTENGCIATDTVCVTLNTAAPAISGTIVTNVSCFAACNGAVSFTVTGGVSPFTYNWSNGATSSSISGVCFGTYTVTVTGANGCTTTETFNLTQPTATLASSAISTQSVSCTGGTNGAASASATGGTAPYSYLWNTGAATAGVTGLAAGTYTVTVTDINGCTSLSNVTITQPAAAITATINVAQNVSCFGGSNGNADLTPVGGTIPYTYVWSNGTTTQDLVNVGAGNYTVTVTDANGCTAIKSASITQPSAALSMSTSMTQSVACFGQSTGAASASVTGGTSPYSFVWSNGANTASLTGLSAGIYSVTVSDANGCTSQGSVSITQPSAALSSSVTSSQQVNCFGGNNGSVNLTVTGGTGPYSYNWNNGASTEDVSNLSAGTYTVTVTDSRGCTASSSVTITQPVAALAATASSTQSVSCFGGNNGSATAGVSGGTAPYNYSWSNGASTQSVSGLSSGNYTVTVTDANGCVAVSSVLITQPAASLSSTLSVSQNVSCFGGNNGSLSLTVTNGTAPYSYSWSNGSTASSLTGVATGTYTVTVTDANGCTNVRTATVTQPAASLTPSINSTSAVSCFGGNNGAVNISVSGGTSPYSYVWNNGATSQDISGVSTGTYTVTITDANGCTATTQAVISQPSASLSANASSNQSVSCFGGNNGAATVNVAGGTAPYSYSWNTGASTQSLTGLSAGSYTVSITDANNCTAVASVQITQPAASLSSSLSVSQNVSCFGGNNGSLSLSVSNGTAPYTYQWNTGSTASSLSGLTSGTYTVTVTDANGCTNIRTATVGQPAAALTPSISSTVAVSCFGGNNGSVNLSVAGGTAPYSYIWNNGATTQDLSSLATGTYTVSISDANGCTANAQVTITQPAAPLAASVSSSQQVSCFGGSNGTVSLSVNGGTAPYSYNWSNGAATQNINGLSAGTYTVTVTDANGCTATQSRVITQPVAALSTSANVSQNVSCFGGNNGSVNLTVSGGTTPYTYVWSNGTSTEDLTGLSAGTYTVTVTDANGCIATRTITVTQPAAALQATAGLSQAVSCNSGSDGQISINVSGGTSPYTYSWSNGAGTPAINGLSAGTYTVTVTDANGCVAVSSATVTQPSAALSGSTAVTSNISCFSGNNGSVDLTVAGGTSPYTFMWNTGAVTEDLTGLPAGSYSVIITDANGCTASASATITQPPGSLSANLNVSQNVACYGGGNGAFDLTVNGGTAPYNYIWSNGSTTQDISGLAIGIYTVSITDANGCISSATGAITQPAAALNATVSSSQNVLCFGGNNGSIDLNVTGGTMPYTYVWSNGSVSQDINNLSNGTYAVSITDANGCTFSQTAGISQPAAALNATLGSSVDVFCFGGDNGSINLSVTGGTAPYTYSWNNGATSQNLNGLTEGTYTVTVTDVNGCNTMLSETIDQPAAAVNLSVQSTQAISCFGGNNGAAVLSASGGTAPYTYVWNTGAATSSISGLTSGTYSATVTDANGCSESVSVTLTQPVAPLSSTVNSTVDVLCFAGNNGEIDITVNGGTAPYTYLWNTGAVTQDISGLNSGTYSVVITDANGCTQNQSATISQPGAQLSSSTSVTANVLCFAGSNGSINLNVSGGTSPYNFIWSNGETTEDIGNLAAGTYTVNITDANGCTSSATAQVTEPAAELDATIASTQNINCFGGNNGVIEVSVAGGTAPYTYSWSNGSASATINGLVSGTYTATVTDANGCSETVSTTLSQPVAALSSTVNATVDVLCFGGNNGEIDITITGGTAPYAYSWSNGSTTQDINGLANGTYTVIVTDANGCTLSESAAISQPAAQLNSSASVTANVLCYSGSNGSIDLNVSGGTAPYNFIWSNGETTEDIGNLSAGTYTVNITDANGCTSTATAQVTEPAASLASSVNATQNVNCFGGNNGSIDLNVIGGTAPYSYNWSNGETTASVSGLTSGTYTVTVTDANGCTSGNTATISQPQAALSSSINGTIDVSCFGGTNGIVDLSVSGGTLPYTFVWSNGETTEDISNLAAGTYSVSVTDVNGCTTSSSVTINEPAAALNPVISSTVQINCFGDETGSVDLSVTGGTAPYTYSWNTGDTTQDIDSLLAGTYVVIVTDVNGCEAVASTTLSQPNAPLLALATVTSNVFCSGGSNGAIDVTVNGGTAPYIYVWSNGETTEDIAGLSTGIYTVTITDANGCTTVVSAGIGQPAQQLNASTAVQDVLCFNGNNGFIDLIPSGGTPPYAFNWSNGSTTEDLGGLTAGTYSVTITDANGCDTLITATVIQPSAPLIPALTVTNNVSCFGGNDGSMSVAVTGGTPPYVYIWNNGEATTTINNLPAGQYTLTVTDANGCNAIISDFVSQPAAALTTPINVSQDVLCYGGTNGELTTNATGGTAPYTYVWNTGATTPGINGLSSGTYTVTVTDSKGCTYTTSGTVSQPTAPLSMTGNATIANCLYGIGGDITIAVNGGTPAYSYSWSNGSTLQNIVNALPGTYTVTVTDANGCTLTNSYTIGNDSEAELQTGPTIICVGDFTTLWVDSIAGASYQWYFGGQPLNGATAPSFTTPAAGYYYVAVTTVCGTFQTDSVEIQVKSVENATVSNNQIICPPEMVQLYATGGVTYVWTPSKFISSTTSPSPIVAPVQTTTYTVEITNEWGCKAELSVNVAVACDTLFVPTGFSPNDDGVNDGYVIDHIENYPGNRLWIYNRWGNLVYKARDYKNDWNGIANVSGIYIGKKVPSGTYYYILDLNDGSKPRAGYLIIRH